MEKQRVAVGRRAHDHVGAERATGAALVLDVDLLAEFVGEIMRSEAADDVDGTARREGNDEPDRPRRIAVGGTRRAAPATPAMATPAANTARRDGVRCAACLIVLPA